MWTTIVACLSLAMPAEQMELPVPENVSVPVESIGSFPIGLEKSDWITTRDDGAVVIDVPDGQEVFVPLGSIDSVPMKSRCYAVVLTVDHKVQGRPAYFEVWTTTDRGGRFFSRTLAGSGPMTHLAGNATQREVIIPASFEKSEASPTTTELSLVLPSGGRVVLQQAGLFDMPGGLASLGQSSPGAVGPWFNARTAGIIGGVFGILVGLIAPVFAWSTQSGRGWIILRWFPAALFGLGLVCLAVTCVAWFVEQPSHVIQLGLVLGALGVFLGPTLYWRTARMPSGTDTTTFESRQMQALDA